MVTLREEGASRPSGAETARRTLRLVEALATGRTLGLEAAAAECGLNRSTAYRLLRVLQEERWAERLPGGGYRLGSAFLQLVVQSAPAAVDLQLLLPVLQELSDLTGETVTLHRRAGDLRVLVLGVEYRRAPLRQVPEIGETFPLVRGCSGRAILSALDEERRHVVITRSGVTDVEELERDLQSIAQTGYATSRGSNHPGVQGIAAPIPGTNDTGSSASLSISGPESRWTAERAHAHLPDLLDACRTVGHLLAAPTP